MQVTTIDECERTFQENVAGALDSAEGKLVELTSTGKIQLHNTGIAIGVVKSKLRVGTECTDVTVRLLGCHTIRAIQDGAITPGTAVMPSAGSDKSLVTAATGAAQQNIGVKVQPGTTGAANDVIEVLVLPRYVA